MSIKSLTIDLKFAFLIPMDEDSFNLKCSTSSLRSEPSPCAALIRKWATTRHGQNENNGNAELASSHSSLINVAGVLNAVYLLVGTFMAIEKCLHLLLGIIFNLLLGVKLHVARFADGKC